MTRRPFDSPSEMKRRVPALKDSLAALCDDARLFTRSPQAESGEIDESGVVFDQARARIESGRPPVNRNAGLRETWTGTCSRQRPRQFAPELESGRKV